MIKKTEPTISKLSDKAEEVFIASGTELDEIIGGGFPRGRITELWGKEGVGKTHLATVLMAHISQNHKILYIDAEYSANKAHMAAVGVDLSKVDYIADSQLERVTELIIASTGKYDVIILDSLAALIPLSVANQEVGERSIALFALLFKHFIVKLRPRLATSKTAFIALNQYRPSLNMYEQPKPPGGHQWFHAVDVRIFMSTTAADKITKDKQIIGHWVKCEVKKNKLSPPHQVTKVKVTY